jgi:L-fuconolactonase
MSAKSLVLSPGPSLKKALMMTDRPTAFGRFHPPREDWLAKAEQEPAREPELPIIDTHHHFWAWGRQYQYLLQELRADADCGHNIVATVFEECHSMYRADGPEEMRVVGETEFVTGIAAMSRSGFYGQTKVAVGIVGAADLTLGEAVEPVLLEQIRAGGGRFCGVRHSGAWDVDPIIGNNADRPGLYREKGFGRGLDVLAGMGLVLDAWVFHTQLDDVIALADAHPDAPIVLCHCGGPLGYGPYAGKKEMVHRKWLTHMTELAKRPNVFVKLGGMMMRLAAYDYRTEPRPPTSAELAALWRPYIEPCIELFGAKRCMVESNFPVERMGIGYGPLWNTFKLITANASSDEKAAIYSETAKQVYSLSI